VFTVLCDLDYIEPIKWNATAFDYLVLDRDYKEVLLTFCRKHDQASQNDEKLIEGKGWISRRDCGFSSDARHRKRSDSAAEWFYRHWKDLNGGSR
jgi:hypothetical protein